MFAYHGRYLRIDATAARGRFVPLDESVLRAFLGGVGLGAWIVAHETPAGLDPLGPEAALVFALSPLVGSPLTTSAKFAVTAFSPLTGRFCDALASSHFAIAAKRAGADAIALTGQCSDWSIVLVDGRNRGGEPAIHFEDATALRGLSAAETERSLRARHGTDWQIVAIGPAGEARIPFANLSHDGRHAGRGGLGAVLGSKRVKALAVRGGLRTAPAHPERTIALARDLSARSFGPATAKYRELGTVANLLVFNRFDAMPTRNFAGGHFENAERLVTEDLAPARRIARHSCAACTIGCEHVYERKHGEGVRIEYESLFALGPLCGVDDPGAVLDAAAACDHAGLDTISAGGTIAFAMDCLKRGIIPESEARLPSGRSLRFGDGAAVIEAIEALTRREGIGAWLALGSRRAAERVGGAATARAMHVKGLEIPGYDPRRLQTMALGFAVGTRGADHNRSGAYEADFSNQVDRLRGGTDSAAPAIATEDRAALIDSMILCKFIRGVFNDFWSEAAAILAAVTGWDFQADELHEIAERVVNARKLLNQREGWTRAEDDLPAGLLSDSAEGPGLTSARLRVMIDEYYRQRGWDENGRVPDALRQSLGLESPAFEGEKRGTL